MPRATIEVADIFRRFGKQYRERHRLPVQQHRIMRAIEVCRTAALGGHIDRCNHTPCGHQHNSYNSCRNRLRFSAPLPKVPEHGAGKVDRGT